MKILFKEQFASTFSVHAGCLLLAAAGVFLTAGGMTQAQVRPRPGPSDSTKPNIVQKHDLEVKFLSGALVGTNYQVGGTIKNIGQAASPGGRLAVLYVRSSDYTRWMFANQLKEVPALRPGEEWRIPTFYLAVKNMPTNRFKLLIHTPPGVSLRNRDANPKNDEKITDATEVR